ncbi:hypothetical protein FQR65_LT17850 [Abscondita terminalis]|nr:hypothetical protein FQR65_LT17850 [Abscondita terminalis]
MGYYGFPNMKKTYTGTDVKRQDLFFCMDSEQKDVEVKLSEEQISTNAAELIRRSDIVILNTPAAYLKAALKDVKPEDFENKIVVSAIKGIVPDENLVEDPAMRRGFTGKAVHILRWPLKIWIMLKEMA